MAVHDEFFTFCWLGLRIRDLYLEATRIFVALGGAWHH
jgi:hypothetical protein